MNLPEKLRSGPFPNRAGLSSSTEMDKGSDKSKHLGNRCEEERRTNPPIQGIQTPETPDFLALSSEMREHRVMTWAEKPLAATLTYYCD